MRHALASSIVFFTSVLAAAAAPPGTESPFLTQHQKNEIGSRGVPPVVHQKVQVGTPSLLPPAPKLHACTKQELQCRGPTREAFICTVAEGNDNCLPTCFDAGHRCMMKKQKASQQ